MENQKNKEHQIKIELSEDMADGTYSNLAIISHSNSEFVLDFIRVVPNRSAAKVKSRIIMTPEHAKRLLQALSDNIDKYENQFGTIMGHQGGNIPPINFNTPPAQA